MTEQANEAVRRTAGGPDPFVVQATWLIASAGGKDQLVQRCGGLVSVRTLDNWTAGNYPRTKVTGAVRDLDTWARENLPDYPAAAGVPALVDSCGPYRAVVPAPAAGTDVSPAERPPADAGPPGDAPAPGVPAGTPRPAPPRWRRWARAAAPLLAVSAVSVLGTLAVVRDDDEEEPAGPPAAEDLVDLPLPSTGDGTTYVELSGSIGANTFADPRTLQDRGAPIPPNTEIEVRCRYYAPSVPSVSPDGFWYLIESDPWNGRWTPANSFMNGDVPGGPYIHNTDFAVPVCR